MDGDPDSEALSIKIEQFYHAFKRAGFTEPATLASYINTILIAEGFSKRVIENGWDTWYNKASKEGLYDIKGDSELA